MKLTFRSLALLLAGVLLLTGCTDKVATQASVDGSTPDAVVIIAGAHANMPAAQFPVELATVLEAAVGAQAPVTVIANDGTPSVSFQLSGYTVSTTNPEAMRNDIDGVTNQVITAVKSVDADADGNDLGAALAVARDQLTADQAVTPMIIVIDSGLSDRGYPLMTTPGILGTDTSERVVEVAQENGYLPMMPTNTTVTFVGLGYVAAPQPDITPAQRKSVKNVWRAFVEASGATAVLIDKPRTGDGPETSFTTGIVATDSYETVSFTTTDDGVVQATVGADVLFESKSSELSPQAQESLEELRDFLVKTPGSILITGHTDATGTDEVNIPLGAARAEATMEWLADHGVDPSRMTAEGRGSSEPVVPYATTPEQLQQNRRVVVTVTP